MKYLLLMIKGFIIGLAKIIPGVSGAVLSISLGVYERLINILGSPLKITFNDLKFLFFLLFGAALGILFLCNGIKFFLNHFYLPTIFLFIGLIIGGMPEIFNEIKGKYTFSNLIVFFTSFLIVLLITNLSHGTTYSNNHFFIMGSIESLTTIVPGISGTAIFMALGWYEDLLSLLNNLLTFNVSLSIAFSFILGFIITTILISKFLTFIFKNYKTETYFCILGFLSSSLWSMLDNVFKSNFSCANLFIGILLLCFGYLFTIKINTFFSKF